MSITIREMFDLTDQVAVITGGARHLGYDMADVLAEAGCHLVITSRQAAQAEAAAERLRATRQRDVLPLAVDVTDPAQVKALAEKALAFKGRVDILINNARARVEPVRAQARGDSGTHRGEPPGHALLLPGIRAHHGQPAPRQNHQHRFGGRVDRARPAHV